MFQPAEYQLLDFGENEKLESFGGIIVRRETPAAIGKRDPAIPWETAQIRFRQTGKSHWQGKAREPWLVQYQERKFDLRQTPTGQLGVFPEQATNWDWISGCHLDLNGAKALNLFAYTGGTTMALAARGVNVVHIDAAKSVVNWARLNAKQSGLEQAPIRWIVEDASTYVERELKRGNTYDIVVADPPSFGRGPNGETWKIQRDLPGLFRRLGQLTSGRCKMFLISCHTPGFDHEKLKSLAVDSFCVKNGGTEGFEMSIDTSTGKRLPSGSCVRWRLP